MIGDLAYAQFKRAFAKPFLYGGRTVTHREGVLLRKEGEIFAEASPLPGHSADSIHNLLPILSTLSTSPELPPSLRFALEGFEAQERHGSHAVRSNALLSLQDIAPIPPGYEIVKIKIGSQGWEKLFGLVDRAPGIRLRLDANQAFTRPVLEALGEQILRRGLQYCVEYLEEPYPGVWNDPALRNFPVPLAADESAPNPAAAEALFRAPNAPSVFIVKPTVAGGLASLDPFVERAQAAGKKCVFTSSLESEAGRRSLIAYLSQKPREVCGLSTGHLFAENFLPDQPEWKTVPPVSAEERAYYDSLDWKACR